MTVVAFPLRSVSREGWRPDELALFIEEFARVLSIGCSWERGATEAGDPQFYLLGPPPERECVFCVTRLGRLYVLEDGHGRVLAERTSLPQLAGHAKVLLRQGRSAIFARIAVMWCVAREVFEEKIEPMMEESAEILAHVAPYAGAFV